MRRDVWGMKTAAVIIPTTGRESVEAARESIYDQSFKRCDPIIVCDGPKSHDNLFARDEDYPVSFDLPYNTGANYWNGHRIYAAIPFLLPHDYIFYLDDDNTYEPDHVASCIDLCESKGLDWCFSFRNIYEKDTFICRDECESIGKWPVWYNNAFVHVDTSCYCLKRQVACEIAPLWNRPLMIDGKPNVSPDVVIANHLVNRYTKFDTTGKFTVNYRLGSELCPKKEFFLQGNEEIRKQHGGKLPWE
jgi:glycosyltransferase involved in cell wall biosynthesis